MTRGKWVALAVGLAVMAVLVHYGPVLWRWVAYVQDRREVVSIPLQGWRAGMEQPEYVLVWRKRRHWLPGRDRWARCSWCVQSAHQHCPRGMTVKGPGRQVAGISLSYWQYCTCPHPSHAQESE